MYIIFFIIWMWAWWALWYIFFYFRYENRKNIDNLHSNYNLCKIELERYLLENKELKEDNKILIDETRKLRAENTDLSKIVADLSRYATYVKIWWEKAKELSRLLWVYDKDLESRIKQIVWDFDTQQIEEEIKNNEKKFF